VHGADAHDVRGGEPSAFELVTHDGAQVDERFAGTPRPRVIPRADDFIAEAIAELRVNFEATLADRRTHRGTNVGRASTERGHCGGRRRGDIRNDAAPSAVQAPAILCLESTMTIGTQSAVKYSQHDARLSGDDPVTRRPKLRSVASRGVNDVAMHLVEARDELRFGTPRDAGVPVGIDGALVVADPVRKIHRCECIRADAASAPDESVADRGVRPCPEDFDGRRNWVTILSECPRDDNLYPSRQHENILVGSGAWLNMRLRGPQVRSRHLASKKIRGPSASLGMTQEMKTARITLFLSRWDIRSAGADDRR